MPIYELEEKDFYELYGNIDWKLLQQQKLTLIHLTGEGADAITQDQVDHIEGLLCLIDSFQDAAVDHFEIPKYEVFNMIWRPETNDRNAILGHNRSYLIDSMRWRTKAALLKAFPDCNPMAEHIGDFEEDNLIN